MSKYILWAIAFLLLLDCAGTIGMYLAWKDSPVECDQHLVTIPKDTVYVDPNTIGTTTDPTDEELKTK
jgi:hypothetical protein